MAWTNVTLNEWVDGTDIAEWGDMPVDIGGEPTPPPFVPLPIPKKKTTFTGMPCKRKGVLTGKSMALVYPDCPKYPMCKNRPAYVAAVTVCRGEVK